MDKSELQEFFDSREEWIKAGEVRVVQHETYGSYGVHLAIDGWYRDEEEARRMAAYYSRLIKGLGEVPAIQD